MITAIGEPSAVVQTKVHSFCCEMSSVSVSASRP